MATKRIKIGSKGYTTVDSEDFERLSSYSWHLSSYGYVIARDRSGDKPRQVTISRVIMGEPEGMVVDHINGDVLDNRKSNLRVCTIAQNTAYKKPRASGTKGICWVPSRQKWQAKICVAGKQITLGRFKDKIEALKAYNAAALEHFGEFAWINNLEQINGR